MKKRGIIFLMAFFLILNLSIVLDFGTVNVEAATPTVVSRITEIGAAYPDKASFFTVNGKSCTHNPESTCSNCKLSNILAARHPEFSGVINGERYTCNAFAYWAFYYIHGHIYTENTTVSYSLANAKQGDFVSFGGGSHYGIYMRDNCVLDANGYSSSTVGEITHLNPYPAKNLPNVVVYHSDAVRGGEGINRPPVYSLDVVRGEEGGIYVAGWSYDPDVATTSMDVHVYIGSGSEREGHVIKADQLRQDVNAALGITGSHGFASHIKTSLRGSQKVEVYALDNKGTLNTLMQTTNVTITNPPVAHTHSYSSVVTKSATCAEAGIRTYTCTCGDSYTEPISRLTTHGRTEIRNAKASQVGVEGYTGDKYCTVCNTLLERGTVIEALQPDHIHSYSSSITIVPTCVNKGLLTYTCTCGNYYTQELDMVGHQYDNGIVTKKATCTEDGKIQYSCEHCDATKEITVQASGHVFVNKSAKPATCTVAGYTGDTCCKVCGTVAKRGTAIAKLAHKWDAGKVTTQPTTTKTGVKVFICSVCKGTKTEAIPKIVAKTVTPGRNVNDSKTNGYYVVLKDGLSVRFVKPVSKKAAVVIPDVIVIDGITCKVTEIGEKAFYKNTTLTSVKIGKNVKVIGKNAFNGCKKMKKVTGAASVATINSGAFYECAKLTSMSLGSKLTTISDKAFYGCSVISKITIPAKVKKIGNQAFYNCKKLNTITIKTTLLKSKTVGAKAFTGSYKTATVSVPSKVLKSYKSLLKSKGINKKAKYKGI